MVKFFNTCSRDENTKEMIKDTSFKEMLVSLRAKARSPVSTKRSLALRVLVDVDEACQVWPLRLSPQCSSSKLAFKFK